ncbi:MAG TPA: cytochrome P450 [Beutenbergiaceae bacterium]|nr:cytochrome P450 [Beutenbergiaceae bacterium]
MADAAGNIPSTSVLDAVRVLGTVVAPVVTGGAIARRPRAMLATQRAELDKRAVATMQHLRDRYGPGPVQVRLPGRRFTFLLQPDQVHRVLNQSPAPFATSTREKRGALGHFQPSGVLISSPEQRAVRKPFNDEVLQAGRTIHHHGPHMADVVREEMTALLGHTHFTETLDWDGFTTAWHRMIRRIVLGDSAREDHAVTNDLLRLRKDANWSFLKPTRARRRRRLLARLARYVDRAEPGSLAQMVAATPAAPGTDKHHQIPQWMFAFDAGTWATLRALALIVTHPGAERAARAEIDSGGDLRYLRACVLESLRLWPTTPAILRDTTGPTEWAGGHLPAGASVVIFAPFFHRDHTRVPQAHQFVPELWLRERTDEDWPLVPFSGGPAMCSGRNVVLHTASVALGHLLADQRYELQSPELSPHRALPGTISPFHLRFALTPTDAATAAP